MVSIDDLQEVAHGRFKEPIIGPLKFKMADSRHFKSLKSFSGHNSAADSPISVKFCTGKQNSMAIEIT